MIGGRRDSSHAPVRDTLRALGASVEDDGDAGGDHMDFRVGVLGVMTFQVEAKSPGGDLTESQADLVKRWRGNPVIVLQSAEEAQTWYLAMVAKLSPLVHALLDVVGGPFAATAKDVLVKEAKVNASKSALLARRVRVP